ncbi:unnamed protein product [Urochloa humidicola]
MRFPNAKMIQDYSRFNLGMRDVNAQIKIEPWTFAMGAKGRLEMGWFKVKGIPGDQRNIRTIAKVGGLVGKTVAIDEATRYKPEYVRMKIVCRDVKAVPPCAECALGLDIYDFHFELEESEKNGNDKLKEPVRVEDHDAQPSPKKPRTETANKEPGAGKGDSNNNTFAQEDKHAYKGGAKKLSDSCPPKIHTGNLGKEADKGKTLDVEIGSQEDLEVIPAAMYEPSNDTNDEDSEDVSGGSNALANEVFHYLSGQEGTSKTNNHIWLTRCEYAEETGNVDNIGRMTQEGIDGEEEDKTTSEINMEELINPCEQMKQQREQRRWSQRIQKDKMEKLMKMASGSNKKRTLEGTSSDQNSFSVLCNDDIIDRSNQLGVALDVNDYAQIDIMRDLELARQALNKKEVETKDQLEVEGQESEENNVEIQAENLSEWLSEETSDVELEEFTVVTSKRNRKPPNRLSLSGIKPKNKKKSKEIPCKKKNREIPCLSKGSQDVCQGNSGRYPDTGKRKTGKS